MVFETRDNFSRLHIAERDNVIKDDYDQQAQAHAPYIDNFETRKLLYIDLHTYLLNQIYTYISTERKSRLTSLV